jgi:hypothetical protein
MPVRRLIRTVDPVSVELARFAVVQIDMPDIVGPLRKPDTFGFLLTLRLVEKAKFDAFCIMGI